MFNSSNHAFLSNYESREWFGLGVTWLDWVACNSINYNVSGHISLIL